MALSAIPNFPSLERLDEMKMFIKHSITSFSPVRSHHVQLRDEKNWLSVISLFCPIFLS